MKICPNCGKVVSYNSYFGAYICTECKWEDAFMGNIRNKGGLYFKSSSSNNLIKKCNSIKYNVRDNVC